MSSLVVAVMVLLVVVLVLQVLILFTNLKRVKLQQQIEEARNRRPSGNELNSGRPVRQREDGLWEPDEDETNCHT